MQVLEQPRLLTEQEDVHLIETFLISTKPNKAGWKINNGDNIQDWVGKDFVIIPEKIFDSNEKQPGHVSGGTYEEEMAEIQKHSHGKITKVKGPYAYEDSPGDYFYNAVIKLSGSKAAAALVDNGSKTWTPFAVSPQLWPEEGTDDNITKYKPMGLFLVIKGAYGDNAVVEKMCSGSALKCGTSLSAAIHQLQHNSTDEFLGEVLSSYLKSIDNTQIDMSQTQVETVQPAVKVEEVKQPVNQPVELKKDEQITLTKNEYDVVQKQLKDQEELRTQVAELKRERSQNILTQVFGSITDEEVKNKVFEKYADKDVNLVKSVYDDINTHILPGKIEAKIAEGKTVKVESKSASTLKPEPKIVKEESKSASVETDDLSLSQCRSILGL